jgi:hypothetical protein
VAAAPPIPEPASPPPAPVRGARLWIRRIAPYAVAAAAVAAVLSRYSIREIAAEMARGDSLPLVPLAAFVILTNILFVATADHMVIDGCTGKPGWLAVLMGKAGSAILGSVGYAAAHGGYGLWIARRTGCGVGLTGGIVLYIMGSELAAVSVVASLSIFLAGAEVGAALRIAAPSVALVLIALQVLGPANLFRTRAKIFEPWRVMPAWRALLQQTVRVCQIAWMVLATWFAARAFGMPIPLRVMAAYLPIVLVVGSLPVNVAGVGAVQLAWLRFTPWAPGEQILAFSFVWQLMVGAAMMLRGLPFLKRVVTDIERGAPRAAEEPVKVAETP